MKNLFTTTAMVLALGFPANLMAQSTETETGGFLAARAPGQLLATDLIGEDVYARRTREDAAVEGESLGAGTEMMTMTAADLDGMDNVGQISDLVLSNDGSVVAVIIGVGGFLGVGEQDVAVTMNEVSFAANADDPDDLYIMVNTTGEMLKTSPQFDRDGTVNAEPAAADVAGVADDADRPMLTAPMMERDGYTVVNAPDVSVDMLIGKAVYGLDDANVGTIDDVTVDEAGAVRNVIIDFGGFLGMGKTQVALTYDELTILTNADNTDVRVYVDATEDQIKAMPVHTATN